MNLAVYSDIFYISFLSNSAGVLVCINNGIGLYSTILTIFITVKQNNAQQEQGTNSFSSLVYVLVV